MPNKTINGVSICYQDRGRGAPVVLVHGFPLDSRMWEAQIEALSDPRICAALDNPGQMSRSPLHRRQTNCTHCSKSLA
jgi:pimeloyl-ACP methyl ester carboxylesterase